MKPLKAKDFKGKYDLTVSLNDTIPYQYCFRKIRGKVYRFSKIGNEEWRKDLTPYEIEPICFI